ncbi:bifunctional 6-phosphofructo-2-kinase/fructose-2,6-bisphosphate 2-phosphatase [Ganoderma leucocontextum]|nr:bifunctional 6-phosphofructo-2-kinase/fructose-2,6-bisphosphate 2-phosphatase [Ganoderma leucocontextum]
MSNSDTPQNSLPPLSDRELAAVDGVLKDMSGDDDGQPVVPITVARDVGTPPAMFGAGGPMLKQFDQSTATSRLISQASTPPRSVVGIGGKVARPDYSEAKIVLAMVGLPARGKSYLSNKLMRYLKWLEYDVKVFNVGQLRRSRARQRAQQSGKREDHTASYFSHGNVEATKLRDQLASDSLEMLIQWLKEGGNVGIHDATNSTRSRRQKIVDRVSREPGIVVIFLESLCDDPALLAANIALKVSSGDPDYKDTSREEAKRDFERRIREYEAVYETITEPHLSYLRIKNVGSQVTLCHIHGYLQSRIAFYLMNLHLKPRSIFFSRHGESQYNVEGKIGGDSALSERGQRYARALPALIMDNIGEAPLTVWTSTLQRTIQTTQHLSYPKLTWKSLDELDAGVCDGMTYEEIEQAYPEDFANRDEDKFNYRYRGGESYRDVVVRLEPVIMELERQENILIIGHQAILRCLYAYFHDLPQADLPYIKIPLHTVIKLTPKAYGCDEERYTLPIGAVDTHRPKPKAPPTTLLVPNTARQYYTKDT